MRTFALSAVAALAAGPLARLQLTANWFYGDHKANADGLLKQKRIEVEHVVAAKRARARMLLQRLESELLSGEFEEVTGTREGAAEYDRNALAADPGLRRSLRRRVTTCW